MELFARGRRDSWSWSDCNWTQNKNDLVLKRPLNHLAELTKWLGCVLSTYMFGAFDHVTYPLQTESALYRCVNGVEHLARSSREIWSLSDCYWTGTQNHLARKQKPIQLAKHTEWLGCVLSTYVYSAHDCIFSSCHPRVSEWIHTL